jgi:hypothetical protein
MEPRGRLHLSIASKRPPTDAASQPKLAFDNVIAWQLCHFMD